MSRINWDKVEITTKHGERVEGIAPVVISASRATDIPAFGSRWFLERLEDGYTEWVNPYNGKSQYVSFKNVRLFVFWSKNPRPFFPVLEKLNRLGISYYFQFTLNDYQDELLEPSLPPLENRMKTFIQLSDTIGRERVLWRFDPLLFTDILSREKVLERIQNIGERIALYTPRLTVSFLTFYPKVIKRFRNRGVRALDPDTEEKREIIFRIAEMTGRWGIDLFTCSQEIDYTPEGGRKGKCIDEEYLLQNFHRDKKLVNFICGENSNSLFSDLTPRRGLRDKGQRQHCGCMKSKDIGIYNTCGYSCVYCYANR
ncbi:hypothetical protein CHISP_0405 [Chitinispirillum alkaliphilum]|nr:hypothetical protein CHISP_0405 [Chitinispirillum alkaliphilum]